MNSNTRQKISNDDTATRALRIVLQQQDLSSRLDVCEALQQQATSKDFALSRPGFATVPVAASMGGYPNPLMSTLD